MADEIATVPNGVDKHDEPLFDPAKDIASVRTADGLADKVKWPAVALAGLGVAGLVAGALLKNEALATIGGSLLGASGLTVGVGWKAPPPAVEHVVEDA